MVRFGRAPNNKMQRKVDGMYMSHPANKNYEWAKENKIKR